MAQEKIPGGNNEKPTVEKQVQRIEAVSRNLENNIHHLTHNFGFQLGEANEAEGSVIKRIQSYADEALSTFNRLLSNLEEAPNSRDGQYVAGEISKVKKTVDNINGESQNVAKNSSQREDIKVFVKKWEQTIVSGDVQTEAPTIMGYLSSIKEAVKIGDKETANKLMQEMSARVSKSSKIVDTVSISNRNNEKAREELAEKLKQGTRQVEELESIAYRKTESLPEGFRYRLSNALEEFRGLKPSQKLDEAEFGDIKARQQIVMCAEELDRTVQAMRSIIKETFNPEE